MSKRSIPEIERRGGSFHRLFLPSSRVLAFSFFGEDNDETRDRKRDAVWYQRHLPAIPHGKTPTSLDLSIIYINKIYHQYLYVPMPQALPFCKFQNPGPLSPNHSVISSHSTPASSPFYPFNSFILVSHAFIITHS